jgi:predicted DNA-binding antitoxin AbrB/MazE fold protein
MSQVIHAIFEDGVFKPLQDVSIKDHERVTLKVVGLDDWQARFAAVIVRIRESGGTRPPEEIEEDIRQAIAEAREERRDR